jgi:hypothetical protein
MASPSQVSGYPELAREADRAWLIFLLLAGPRFDPAVADEPADLGQKNLSDLLAMHHVLTWSMAGLPMLAAGNGGRRSAGTRLERIL